MSTLCVSEGYCLPSRAIEFSSAKEPLALSSTSTFEGGSWGKGRDRDISKSKPIDFCNLKHLKLVVVQSFWVKLSFLGSGKISPKCNPVSIHGVKGKNQPKSSMSTTLIASVAASTTASKKVVRCPTKLFVFWVDYRTVIICNRQGCHPKRGSGHRCGGERCRWAW